MKVALATSTTPAATGRRSRGMVTPCGLRLDGVVKVEIFDNASSERSRESVMLEQSEASKNAGLLCLANSHCKSNLKKKPALCEQQLLLAANKDKEWGMFERCIILLLLFNEYNDKNYSGNKKATGNAGR